METFKDFYKYSSDGYPGTPNDVYKAEYNSTSYSMTFFEEFWFRRELYGLDLIAGKDYAPEIESVDEGNRKITFKWYDSSLSHLLFFGKEMPSDWVQQLKSLLQDLESNNLYKLNFYPHTVYVKDNKLKIHDLYGCCKGDEKIPLTTVNDVIRNWDRFKFTDGYLDIVTSYRRSIDSNAGDWPISLNA